MCYYFLNYSRQFNVLQICHCEGNSWLSIVGKMVDADSDPAKNQKSNDVHPNSQARTRTVVLNPQADFSAFHKQEIQNDKGLEDTLTEDSSDFLSNIWKEHTKGIQNFGALEEEKDRQKRLELEAGVIDSVNVDYSPVLDTWNNYSPERTTFQEFQEFQEVNSS